MPIEIKIPRLGWSMEEGVFSGWIKQNGDSIKSGDPLFTLEGEKSAQDIESTDSGTLQIPKEGPQPGDTVKVGQVIGLLVGKDEVAGTHDAIPKTPPIEEKIQKDGSDTMDLTQKVADSEVSTNAVQKITDPISSPRARRKAAELGVEIKHLRGNGNAGRIIEADVLEAAANQGHSTSVNSASTGRQVSVMRRNIADRTALSFSQIPHFYLRAEVDVTELVMMRELLVGVLEKESDVRITLTDFLLRAQAIALHGFPSANAVWQNGSIVGYADADIGVVVSLQDGLVIPVIRAAQKLSFVQLAKERARLVEAVRAGQFDAKIFEGGSTSLSNLGAGRADEFAAIIPPHQSSILAVGRAALRPYLVNGRIEARTTLKLCLSVDHRVLDGAPAADFLGRIVQLLENPKTLTDGV